MKTSNDLCKALIFVGAVVLCFSLTLPAEEISVRTKKGVAGSIEVIGVTGDSLKFKGSRGTMLLPLKDFDEDSLIRIIKELGKLNNAISPAEASSPKPSGATGKAIEMTLKRLEVFGEDYVGKLVRFSNAEFYKIDQDGVTRFPMVQIKSNGLITTYRKDEAAKWVNFAWDDAEGSDGWYALADKKQWAEFLLTLEDDDKINIEGVVVALATSDDYGLIVTKIERVK